MKKVPAIFCFTPLYLAGPHTWASSGAHPLQHMGRLIGYIRIEIPQLPPETPEADQLMAVLDLANPQLGETVLNSTFVNLP